MTKLRTIFRSKLKAAKRSDNLYNVDAAYGSGKIPRPVCSVCWSQLDTTWGKGHGSGVIREELSSQSGGDWVDKDGEVWLVWEDRFRCMNPDCHAANKVRTLPAKLSFAPPYHPEDVKALKITSRKYSKGRHRDDGVFELPTKVGGWAPLEVEFDHYGVTAREELPWVYIFPGDLEESIPSHWTTVAREIKTNKSSQRFEDICKWFATRGIKISELLDNEN